MTDTTQTTTKPGKQRLIGVIALIVSVGFFALAAYLYTRVANFKKVAVEAPGVVIAMKEGSGSNRNNTTYYPIVQYTDKAGKEQTMQSKLGSSPPSYAVNDQVTVLYDPANPTEARIKSVGGLWFLPLLLCGVGAVGLLVAVTNLIAAARAARRAESVGG